MTKFYPGEEWKQVKFETHYTNEFRLEVSNFGRLRTFNRMSNGNIVNGTLTEGYRVIRLKLFHPRDEEVQQKLDFIREQVFLLIRKVRNMKKHNEPAAEIEETEKLLAGLREALKSKTNSDVKKRTVNFHALVHRLVAEYFLPVPDPVKTVVAHLDFNKLNNRVTNLRWMTKEENYEHQQNSPNVIQEKKDRQQRGWSESKSTKLSVTKVMLLKKLLNEGKTVSQMVKQFKVTDMQIYRIKRGENWGNIPAAK